MSKTVSNFYQTASAGTFGLRALLGRLLRSLGRERRARRALREMAMLDDHMLADIGLDRASIGFAAEHGRVPGTGSLAEPRRHRESEPALYDRRFFSFL